MRPESRKFLFDIVEAGSDIERFCAGKMAADYLADPMLRAAVERKFEIIVEALSRFSKLEPVLAAGIPDAQKIVAFRSVLAHGYGVVNDRVV